jgi:hypothetical protein
LKDRRDSGRRTETWYAWGPRCGCSTHRSACQIWRRPGSLSDEMTVERGTFVSGSCVIEITLLRRHHLTT